MHEFIAEIGTSHLGSFDKARRMIDAARDAGATTAKFQWVIADEIVSQHAGVISLPSGATNIYQYFVSVEQEPEFYAKLKSYTEACGLRFLCSVFGLRSLELLLQLKSERVKIASPEVNHIQLLEALAQHHVSVVLSSGVSSFIDLLRAIDILRFGKVKDIAVLRCVSQYPASPYSYSLQVLEKYQSLFGCVCGVSDHTQEPAMLPAVAAACGSSMVEKHLTLPAEHADAAISPDDPIALLPQQFLEMVETTTHIANIYKSKGTHAAQAAVKKRYGAEKVAAIIGATHAGKNHENSTHATKNCAVLLPHYFTTRRSLFAGTDIAAGTALTQYNCALLRSEHNSVPGIPTEAYEFIINKHLNSAVQQGMPIGLEHFC